MSDFPAAWLRLREPYDALSRNRRVLALLARWAQERGTIRAVDLGGGTGSNVRFLAPRLGCRQNWVVIDKDDTLLAAVPDASTDAIAPAAESPSTISTECRDIAAGFSWLDRSDADLVTASALLDLVSAGWLEALLERCSAQGISIHFALTYNGLIRFDPPDGADVAIRDALNRHQRGDKGFGSALGPAAAPHAARTLRRLGYNVHNGDSSWRLGPADGKLQRALVDGWARVIPEIEPDYADLVRTWHERRSALIAAGASALMVGHDDLTALPADKAVRDSRSAPAGS